MFLPLGLFASSFVPPQGNSAPAMMKGSYLFHACQADIALQDSLPDADARIAMATGCVNYIGGYIDGARSKKQFCLDGATNGTIVRVYVAFMQANPKLLDEDREVGVNFALLYNYPCKSATKK